MSNSTLHPIHTYFPLVEWFSNLCLENLFLSMDSNWQKSHFSNFRSSSNSLPPSACFSFSFTTSLSSSSFTSSSSPTSSFESSSSSSLSPESTSSSIASFSSTLSSYSSPEIYLLCLNMQLFLSQPSPNLHMGESSCRNMHLSSCGQSSSLFLKVQYIFQPSCAILYFPAFMCNLLSFLHPVSLFLLFPTPLKVKNGWRFCIK